MVAWSIIQHLKLTKEEVLVISAGYQVPDETYQVIPSFSKIEGKGIRKVFTLNTPKSFDRYLESFIQKQDFIAYVDLMANFQKLLVTHPQCKGFHFFEEGNSAYMAKDDLTDLTWNSRKMKYRSSTFSKSWWQSVMRALRGFNLRLQSIPYHYNAYTHFENLSFYCFSENAFYNAPAEKKVILKPEADQLFIQQMAKGFALEQEVIWIDGSNSRYTGIEASYYHDSITEAISILQKKRDLNRVYVKLRPGLSSGTGIFLVEALESAGIEVQILPADINLESLFIRSNECTVIGNLTAALEYAHAFGHTVYSTYYLSKKKANTFLDRMDGFWKNMKDLSQE